MSTFNQASLGVQGVHQAATSWASQLSDIFDGFCNPSWAC